MLVGDQSTGLLYIIGEIMYPPDYSPLASLFFFEENGNPAEAVVWRALFK